MTEETGTLAELNVKPRDVVEWIRYGMRHTIITSEKVTKGTWAGQIKADLSDYGYGIFGDEIFRIVSRASDTTPKTWGEMTDEEKGALLLAYHEGKVIEFYCYGRWINTNGDIWHHAHAHAYRVRPPEPKRETVTLYGCVAEWGQASKPCGEDTHRITMPLLDDNIPAGTYTSEAGETIIVEEL